MYICMHKQMYTYIHVDMHIDIIMFMYVCIHAGCDEIATTARAERCHGL